VYRVCEGIEVNVSVPRAIVATFLAASPAFAQITSDPFPTPAAAVEGMIKVKHQTGQGAGPVRGLALWPGAQRADFRAEQARWRHSAAGSIGDRTRSSPLLFSMVTAIALHV
jgi:hypothetical protein